MVGTGNETCDKLMNIDFNGNVIHSLWFKTIVKENGKADLVAINILADIVYWYRPTPVRDEESGKVIGYRKKFKADLLQRNYDSYADQFGLSKGQVYASIVRLEKLGIIKRVFRTLNVNGMILNNVLHIELTFEGLVKYSTEKMENTETPPSKKSDPSLKKKGEGAQKNQTPPLKKTGTSLKKMGEAPQKNAPPVSKNQETNTKTSTKTLTETLTENNNNICGAMEEDREVVVNLLKEIGATEKKAVELVAAFGTAMIREKLCILAQRKETINPIGFIIQALRDDYKDAGAMFADKQRKERDIIRAENKRLTEAQQAALEQSLNHEQNENAAVQENTAVNQFEDAQKKAEAFMHLFCLKYHFLLKKDPEAVEDDMVRAKLTDIYYTGTYDSVLFGRLTVPNASLRGISDSYFKKYRASARGLQHFLSDEVFSNLTKTFLQMTNTLQNQRG
jgi:hypothetical protein